MNIPAFTAEDSLYISRTQYNVTARHYYQTHQLNSTLLAQGNVVPQVKKTFAYYCLSECSFWDKLLLRGRWCGHVDFDTETGIFDMTDPSILDLCHF
jgi:hypothetical protein